MRWDASAALRFLSPEFWGAVSNHLGTRVDGLLPSLTPGRGDFRRTPLGFCVSGDGRQGIYLKLFVPDDGAFDREFQLIRQ